MSHFSFKATCLALAVGLTTLSGCTSQPIMGTEAVLVPVKTELKLGYKAKIASEKQKLDRKAYQFIVSQFEAGAEQITVTAYSNKGKQLQNKLQSQLGKYRPWMRYQTELKQGNSNDLVIYAARTQVIMPPCPPLGSYNAWSMSDGCFVDRARNKSLATPSTLKPVISELSIAEDK